MFYYTGIIFLVFLFVPCLDIALHDKPINISTMTKKMTTRIVLSFFGHSQLVLLTQTSLALVGHSVVFIFF